MLVRKTPKLCPLGSQWVVTSDKSQSPHTHSHPTHHLMPCSLVHGPTPRLAWAPLSSVNPPSQFRPHSMNFHSPNAMLPCARAPHGLGPLHHVARHALSRLNFLLVGGVADHHEVKISVAHVAHEGGQQAGCADVPAAVKDALGQPVCVV